MAKLMIGRSWQLVSHKTEPVYEGRTPIVLKKGAFGSGEHETTASCLEILETLPLHNCRVLDFGSGTGILAICSILRGASRAVCIDIEPLATETSSINAAENGMTDRTDHLCCGLEEVVEEGFDLVLGNIFGDILIKYAPLLAKKTNAGGLMLLSGILYEYNYDVRQCFERLGFSVLKNRLLEDYSTLLLKKDQAS